MGAVAAKMFGDEYEHVNPAIRARIEAGINTAALQGGQEVEDAGRVQATFDALKRELLSPEASEVEPLPVGGGKY